VCDGGNAAELQQQVANLAAVGEDLEALDLRERVRAHDLGDGGGDVFGVADWDADGGKPAFHGGRVRADEARKSVAEAGTLGGGAQRRHVEAGAREAAVLLGHSAAFSP